MPLRMWTILNSLEEIPEPVREHYSYIEATIEVVSAKMLTDTHFDILRLQLKDEDGVERCCTWVKDKGIWSQR